MELKNMNKFREIRAYKRKHRIFKRFAEVKN